MSSDVLELNIDTSKALESLKRFYDTIEAVEEKMVNIGIAAQKISGIEFNTQETQAAADALKRFEQEEEKITQQTPKMNSSLFETVFTLQSISTAVSQATSFWINYFKATALAADNANSLDLQYFSLFADTSDEATESLNRLKNDLGRTTGAVQEMMIATGTMISNFDITGASAVKTSEDVTKLVSAIGNFKNVDTSQVMQTINMALAGNSRSLRQLGIIIKDDDLKNRILQDSMKGIVYESESEAKAMAMLALITERSSNAISVFSDKDIKLSEQMKKLYDNFGELYEVIGAEFLPIVIEITKQMSDALKHFNALSESEFGAWIQKITIYGGTFVGVMGTLIIAKKTLIPLIKTAGISLLQTAGIWKAETNAIKENTAASIQNGTAKRGIGGKLGLGLAVAGTAAVVLSMMPSGEKKASAKMDEAGDKMNDAADKMSSFDWSNTGILIGMGLIGTGFYSGAGKTAMSAGKTAMSAGKGALSLAGGLPAAALAAGYGVASAADSGAYSLGLTKTTSDWNVAGKTSERFFGWLGESFYRDAELDKKVKAIQDKEKKRLGEKTKKNEELTKTTLEAYEKMIGELEKAKDIIRNIDENEFLRNREDKEAMMKTDEKVLYAQERGVEARNQYEYMYSAMRQAQEYKERANAEAKLGHTSEAEKFNKLAIDTMPEGGADAIKKAYDEFLCYQNLLNDESKKRLEFEKAFNEGLDGWSESLLDSDEFKRKLHKEYNDALKKANVGDIEALNESMNISKRLSGIQSPALKNNPLVHSTTGNSVTANSAEARVMMSRRWDTEGDPSIQAAKKTAENTKQIIAELKGVRKSLDETKPKYNIMTL
ncbi:MAG: hypothetical protein LBT46_15495 [Planctomycetaceae bacterium]|nr:hypothetical protein [Planctomycetaceae bacterium]